MNKSKDDFKFAFIGAMFIGLMITLVFILVMNLGRKVGQDEIREEVKSIEYMEIKTDDGKTYKVSKDSFIEFANGANKR